MTEYTVRIQFDMNMAPPTVQAMKDQLAADGITAATPRPTGIYNNFYIDVMADSSVSPELVLQSVRLALTKLVGVTNQWIAIKQTPATTTTGTVTTNTTTDTSDSISGIMDTVKENPVIALAAVGAVAWFLFKKK